MSLSTSTLRIQNRLVHQSQSGRKHWDLYRWLLDPILLCDATHLVLKNDGSAGIDQVACASIKGKEWDFAVSLSRKLREKSYKPTAVRRVYIPKKDGRKRPLGIPNLEDRVVQRALVILMEPIYEQVFLPCSFGFRPGKRAQDCVAQTAKAVYKHRYVLEADIESFFDRVNHKKLVKMLGDQIVDPRVVRLIKSILKTGFQEVGKPWQPTPQGTPQGGPLSPLLANIYLHYVLDQKFAKLNSSNSKLFRYADDFVIVCRTQTEVRAMKQLVKEWLKEADLNLKKEKTKVIDMRNKSRSHDSKFDFLGFKVHLRAFRDNPERFWIARQPSEEARASLRQTLKEKLTANLSREEASKLAKSIWKGWAEYFRYGNANRIFYRQVKTVKRVLIGYLRRKYRRQRRPVPWRKLLKWWKYMTKRLRPTRVIPDSVTQKSNQQAWF